MSTDESSVAPAAAVASTQVSAPAQPTGLLRELKTNLDDHSLFWIALVAGLAIFYFVPQIRNIWTQGPADDLSTWFGYVVFLVAVLPFYLLSPFVVMRYVPIQRLQDRIDQWVGARMDGWSQKGKWRYLSPWYWISCFTWRLPDLVARWLVAWVSDTNPPASTITRGLRYGAIALAFLVGLGAFVGPSGESSLYYPLAGNFCGTFGRLGLLTGAWLAYQTYCRERWHDQHPGRLGTHLGRILAWLIFTVLAGETLWVLASLHAPEGAPLWVQAAQKFIGEYVSYRFYTIWAAAQFLTTLIIVALLADRCHAEAHWPVRPVVLVLLLVAVWHFTRAATVAPDDFTRDLSLREFAATKAGTASWGPVSQRDEQWYQQFLCRIRSIKQGPAVIVAASGGGSRAAIFTALTLDTLARTPVEPDSPEQPNCIFNKDALPADVPTWADNLVLVSSVSGGSLATAYFVARLDQDPKTEPRTVPGLRNTTQREVIVRLNGVAEKLLVELPDQQPRNPDPDAEAWADFLKDCLPGLPPLAPDRQKRLDYLFKQKDKLAATRTELLKDQHINKLQLRLLEPGEDGDAGRDADRLEKEIEKVDARLRILQRFLATLQSYCFSRDHREHPDGHTADAADPCARFEWVLRSRAFDEMCLDFMAPIMRGSLSPVLDRGDSLARFWTRRFDWYDCTNLRGYRGSVGAPNYDCSHPLVIFNSSDVARGARLAVGFPPLPSDLWHDAARHKSTHERPHSLNENALFPNAEVSLARAVRMSSNFPFGFRVMELAPPVPDAAGAAAPSAQRTPLHLVDGGVVDNTGLDTVYELFRALEAETTAKPPGRFADLARTILQELRQRGVVILEIDAGAKPNDTPERGLLSGQSEPIGALNNAAYTNAEQAKELYLKEIRQLLKRDLSDLTQSDSPRVRARREASVAQFKNRLPHTTLPLKFECNHYQPGEGAQDVMTAWALGPADKVDVLHSFLIELAVWDMRREAVAADLRNGQDDYETTRKQAWTKLVLDEVTDLNWDYTKFANEIQGRQVLSSDQQEKRADLRKRYTLVEKDVGTTNDEKVMENWRTLQEIVKPVEMKTTAALAAKTPEERQRLSSEALKLLQDKVRELEDNQQLIENKAHAYTQAILDSLPVQSGPGGKDDPGKKYQLGSQLNKKLFEKR